MKFTNRIFLLATLFIVACQPTTTETPPATANPQPETSETTPFVWENANVYFLMTDRFYNGDPTNDVNFERSQQAAPLRGFQGGDLKGLIQKIEEGYFTNLGINAIWMTPLVEQIKGSVDEGTGTSFGFHGYWTRDWTALDPNFGTEEDLARLVDVAHSKGIRILLDAVANHTGPVTPRDSEWPAGWVRTGPQCTYTGLSSTVTCTLVKNLPDIKTDSNEEVDLPPFLVEKWKKEGRLEKEQAELDAFFAETGYPRTPRHYIIKWLVDYIKKYGVDGFRVDTVKHTEDYVWAELWKEAVKAFNQWKKEHPDKVLDDNEFYMVGEVYNYNISGGRMYDYGDEKVDFFKDGFKSLINFEFKYDALKDYEFIFSKYSKLLQSDLKGKSVLNYISSHDDGSPFDVKREQTMESATKLLLCPGGVQVYYGDETARILDADAKGDAKLRSPMNWEELANNAERNGVMIREILSHWQKLGQFRRDHPSVGAGVHQQITAEPYTFQRTYTQGNYTDKVVVGLGLAEGEKSIAVGDVFADGTVLKDMYSGKPATVKDGKVELDTPFSIALLAK